MAGLPGGGRADCSCALCGWGRREARYRCQVRVHSGQLPPVPLCPRLRRDRDRAGRDTGDQGQQDQSRLSTAARLVLLYRAAAVRWPQTAGQPDGDWVAEDRGTDSRHASDKPYREARHRYLVAQRLPD